MSIRECLERERKELLDLGRRNRLLNTPRHKSRTKTIEVIDELSDQIFKILHKDRKEMTFRAAEPQMEIDDADVDGDEFFLLPPLPEDDGIGEDGLARRHTDTRLQTRLSPERLQKRLRQLHQDARTAEEEQGVNLLFLAVGFLKWYESDSSDIASYAPLIVLPVSLNRKSAAAQFRLRYSEEEFAENLSLAAKLDDSFGITLPPITDPEDLDVREYFDRVRAVVAQQRRWEVNDDDMVLGLFSFAKFLMYRDLDPKTWPERAKLEAHPLLGSLCGDGFTEENPVPLGEENIDEWLHPADWVHIMDADSSQALVIEEVRRGRNLVIQGPPGTGKSQTISNIIGAAVKDGKRVLFVAEKRAALDVVKRRLDDIGLGRMCLELHSHRARKKAVLEDLKATLENTASPTAEHRVSQQLRAARDRLNAHVHAIHTPIGKAGVTPFKAIGELARLRLAGLKPAAFQIAGAVEWDRDEVENTARTIQELAERVEELGVPAHSPWRGVNVEALLPTDVDRLTEQMTEVASRLQALIDRCREFEKLLDRETTTLAQVDEGIRLADAIADAPEFDRSQLVDPVWSDRRNDIDKLVAEGDALATAQKQLHGVFIAQAWETDLTSVRVIYAARGNSLFRWLSAEYRSAKRTLQGYLADRPPKTSALVVRMLDTLAEGRRTMAVVLDGDELGRAAFGRTWKGEASEWEVLRDAVSWEARVKTNLPKDFYAVASRVGDAGEVSTAARALGEVRDAFCAGFDDIVETLCLDLSEAFGVPELEHLQTSVLSERLQTWVGAPMSVHQWILYRSKQLSVRSHGLDEVVDQIFSGQIAASELIDLFWSAYYEALIRHAWEERPVLRDFDGTVHSRVVMEFKALDVQRIELARREVMAAHRAGVPRGGTAGEIGVVRREIQKKRRHLAVRKLMLQAGRAVQAMKPVFMMSPMSIAQYLQPGGIEFDLLLIDEASQVLPVDAFGAVARCTQMVVVGDERQLPPTTFFTKGLIGESDDDDDDEPRAADVESILKLCVAQGLPDRMLEWHYRSRHESLIAVSNHEFYNDRLFIVPSSWHSDKLGLKFRFVPDGEYDRSASRRNRNEAQVVAQAVIKHAKDHPDMTLGVGAFSVQQRDVILDYVELFRRQHQDVEEFFAETGPEPFFVKNLEAIQGDEREVIFVSVGYGKDASGYFAMNFGPVSKDGGERRLNVLMTRARSRCVIFSSIKHGDIDLNRTRMWGPSALKTFLHYAEQGFIDTPKPTGRSPESPFEEAVAKALRGLGYDIEPQVGVAGFFVDMAIKDPEAPGSYLLGIECDGATYHSARWARDRDRLRQAVLEDRGWKIHRIWSTDWFRDADAELRKVVASVDQAPAPEPTPAPAVFIEEQPVIETPPLSIEEQVDGVGPSDCRGITVKPYQIAALSVDFSRPPHEVFTSELFEVVLQIVEIEGPVHVEEITRRVRDVWGLERAGGRIREAVRQATRYGVERGRLQEDDNFFVVPGAEVFVRDRSGVQSATLLNPEMLPPAELQRAIVIVVEAHIGMTVDECVTEVVRLFGFKRTGSELRENIEEQVREALASGQITIRDARLFRNS